MSSSPASQPAPPQKKAVALVASINKLGLESYIKKLAKEERTAVENAKLSGNATPLFTAALRGQLKVVRALLKGGANPDEKTRRDGETPLYIASTGFNVAVVKALIKAGADVNLEMGDGSTALHAASAIPLNWSETVDLLLKAGANANAANKYRQTPLHYAVMVRNINAIKLLLHATDIAGVNAADINNDTPLHIAANNGSDEAGELLIAAGADLKLVNKDGETPRDIAVRRGHAVFVKMLPLNTTQTTTKRVSISEERCAMM